MPELMQNLIELNAIYDRMLTTDYAADVTVDEASHKHDDYIPVDGVTYLV